MIFTHIIPRNSVFLKKSFFFGIAFISEKLKIALSVIYLPNITGKVGFQLPISKPLQLITNRCFLLRENLITVSVLMCKAEQDRWLTVGPEPGEGGLTFTGSRKRREDDPSRQGSHRKRKELLDLNSQK